MNALCMKAHFHKYQALGNDYLVIDPSEFPFAPEPARIKAICDRNLGIGSDGILFGPLPAFDESETGFDTPLVRIFNPDGSEAEKSGNGVRIFARYLVDTGRAADGPFPILTTGGRVTARTVGVAGSAADGEAQKGAANQDSDDTANAATADPPNPAEPVVFFEIDMGKANFASSSHGLRCKGPEFVNAPLSLRGDIFAATFVSMGNPHCVILVRCATRELATRYGPLAERHPLFPERTNVQFMEVVDRKTIKIEIWERGAGYTLASGSSSCAAASAARRLGLVDDKVRVMMPGGFLDIAMSDERVLMTGPVRKVFDGRFAPEFLRGIGMGDA